LGYALGILAGLLLHVLVLCALSGEATALAAPLAVAIATRVSDSQQWGMAAILVFLSVGLVGLSFVREERAEAV